MTTRKQEIEKNKKSHNQFSFVYCSFISLKSKTRNKYTQEMQEFGWKASYFLNLWDLGVILAQEPCLYLFHRLQYKLGLLNAISLE